MRYSCMRARKEIERREEVGEGGGVEGKREQFITTPISGSPGSGQHLTILQNIYKKVDFLV